MGKTKIAALVAALVILASAYSAAAGMLSADIAAFFVFITIVGFLIYRDRAKVKLEGIVFIRRTQKGRAFIDRTAQGHRSFWSALAVVGAVVAVPLLILGSAYLVATSFSVASGSAEGGVRLLLPGPVSSPVNAPGIFVVPWWIWVIGIAAVIIPHEFMHGIVCRLHKIKIKSVGWLLLLVIPGAFVEPDEKQLKKASRKIRLKVYAAGSFANMLMALAVLIIFVASFAAFFQPAGVFVNTAEGGPAAALAGAMTITKLDGMPMRNSADISATLQAKNPGDTISVSYVEDNLLVPRFSGLDFFIPKPAALARGEEQVAPVVLAQHPERPGAYLGIAAALPAFTAVNAEMFSLYQPVALVLLWIYLFSFGIGIVNLLPIKPLDGGLIFEELVGHFTKRTQLLVRSVTGLMIFLIIFNIVGPVFIG